LREAPEWFNEELGRIGGMNHYGEPIFRLVWSPEARTVFGGQWAHDGFAGYRLAPAVPGTACWALMVWEPREMQGSQERWADTYRDEATGLLQCGGYPKYGRYALLQRFLHREIVAQQKERQWMDKGRLRREVLQRQQLATYRMEPCGLILDMILPCLVKWRKLSATRKAEAILDEERRKREKEAKLVKEAYDGNRMSRMMKSSALVQKRAELIEKGFRAAMAMAAHAGLGMRISE